LFFGTISLINADGMVKNVLEDTICMDLLGIAIIILIHISLI